MSDTGAKAATRRPRRLVLMGSGETTNTMTGTHRSVFSSVGPGRSVLLDTPAGFQENVDDLAERITEYFSVSLQRAVEVIQLRSVQARPGDVGAALAAVRDAVWVFAGPGSPSYAQKVWAASGMDEVLRDRLRSSGPGGAIVLASAACCTAGVRTVPVYEIYKAGLDPSWLPGMDLTALVGFDAVVVPHFDNTEGGNHDTRFCYLGERRLRMLEDLLEASTWVLGVDEHTSVDIDLDRRSVEVRGLGGLTVRYRNTSQRMSSGTSTTIDEVLAIATELGATSAPRSPTSSALTSFAADGEDQDLALVEAEFAACVEVRDMSGAARAVLDLDDVAGPSARAARARLVERLAGIAAGGVVPRKEIVGPFVETLLALRKTARAEKRFGDADAVRDVLGATGVEVRDTPEGVEWILRDTAP